MMTMAMRMAESRHKRLTGEDENQKGISLLEMIGWLAVAAIIIAIGIPAVYQVKKAAEQTAAKSDVQSAATAMETGYTLNGSYPTTVTALADNGYRASANVTLEAPIISGTGSPSGPGNAFCVEAAHNNQPDTSFYFISSVTPPTGYTAGRVVQGSCPAASTF